jgi:hypothetical protein
MTDVSLAFASTLRSSFALEIDSSSAAELPWKPSAAE